MSESFLHYLWQFQYFNKEGLQTTNGESVQVFHPGIRNANAGPDFFQARVKMDGMEWVGSIEIHINSSSWLEHKHDTDPAYDNVILHVVWKDDKTVKRNDNTFMPTLELKNRVDEKLVLKYKKLINSPETIPCSASFQKVNELTKLTMLDKSLLERLEIKALGARQILVRNNNDWEETFHQLLCKNFGFKVNAEPFQQLAQALPVKVLMKHSDKLIQVEALLFGQAGFLENEKGDEYYQQLKREYKILSQKFSLSERKLNKAQWRFLRLRPANFPSIRLAQLASLIFRQKNIFSKIIEAASYRDLKNIFLAQQSEYWLHHYQFAKKSKEEVATLGNSSIDNVIINTVVPLVAAYGKSKDEQRYMDTAFQILQEIPSENNVITKQWALLGLKSETAFDSQALIELHNNFCMKRRCLDCNIGSSLIRPSL